MKAVIKTFIHHAPTLVAAALLVFTITYHWLNVSAAPAPKTTRNTQLDIRELPKEQPKIAPTELKLLLNKPIFGQIAKQSIKKEQAPIEEQKILPKTRLQLKLNGVVAHTDEKKGHAIIDDSEYRVGETIKNNVLLHAVYPDRVVLKNNQQLEELRLPEIETAANSKFSRNRNSQFARQRQPQRRQTRTPRLPTTPPQGQFDEDDFDEDDFDEDDFDEDNI